jgi:predicted dehydrogenase
LLRLSKESGVKQTVVGLRGRFEPSVATLKRIISDGTIGKVLSSTWMGCGGNFGLTESERVSYMLDKNFGGIMVTVHFGHSIDYIQQGELSSFNEQTSVVPLKVR